MMMMMMMMMLMMMMMAMMMRRTTTTRINGLEHVYQCLLALLSQSDPLKVKSQAAW